MKYVGNLRKLWETIGDSRFKSVGDNTTFIRALLADS
jgi:hypothetical protein